MKRFDTPRDRESIENLKRIYFLDEMFFYEPLSPYYDLRSQTFFLHSEDEETDLPLTVVPYWELWNIPDGHPLEDCLKWDEKIDSIRIGNPLKESLEILKSLDSEIVRLHKLPFGDLHESVLWKYRIANFLKGRFDVLSKIQEDLIVNFIQSCATEYLKEFDKFYLPFVEV